MPGASSHGVNVQVRCLRRKGGDRGGLDCKTQRRDRGRPSFLDLVDLDLFDVCRQWLKPPPPTAASAAAAAEAAEAARMSAEAAKADRMSGSGMAAEETGAQPQSAQTEESEMFSTAASWKEDTTLAGRKYYYNAVTNCAQWAPPAGWPLEKHTSATAASSSVEISVDLAEERPDELGESKVHRTGNVRPDWAHVSATAMWQAASLTKDKVSYVSAEGLSNSRQPDAVVMREGKDFIAENHVSAQEMTLKLAGKGESRHIRRDEEQERQRLRAEKKEQGIGVELPLLQPVYEAPEGFDVDIILLDQLPHPDWERPLEECALVLAALLRAPIAQPFVAMAGWLRPFLISPTTTSADRAAMGPLDLKSVWLKHVRTRKFYKTAQQMREDVVRVLRLATQGVFLRLGASCVSILLLHGMFV